MSFSSRSFISYIRALICWLDAEFEPTCKVSETKIMSLFLSLTPPRVDF